MTSRSRREANPVAPDEQPEAEQADSQTESLPGIRLEMLPIADIIEPAGYIESEYDDFARENLSRSMASVGQDSSINVTELSEAYGDYPVGAYILTGGKHRKEEAEGLGQTHIRAEVKRGTYQNARRANRANAFNQSKLSLWSEIAGIGFAIDEEGLTFDDLVEEGQNPGRIETRYNIWTGGCEELKVAIQQNFITTIGAISLIAEIEDHEVQAEVVHEYLNNLHWRVEDLRAYILGLEAGEADSDEDDGGETEHVEFNARVKREPEPQKVKCSVCGTEDDTGDTTTLILCPGCVRAVRQVKSVPSLQRGVYPIPGATLEGLMNVAGDNPLAGGLIAEARAIMKRADEEVESDHH